MNLLFTSHCHAGRAMTPHRLQHGKYSFMRTSRQFKSSCLPKAAVTPLPCPASPVPAAALPTSPAASPVSARPQGHAISFHPDLNADRRAIA